MPTDDGAVIELGLVVTPALEDRAVEKLTDDLAHTLSERYPGTRWHITTVRDPLVAPPVGLSELVDAARARLLAEQWDLVVDVTELPLLVARRPVVAHSSPTHSAALVSLPALGLVQTQRRLVEAIADAVGVLAGDSPEQRLQQGGRHRRRVQRFLAQLAEEVEDADALQGMILLRRVVTGNLRLIAGMVRANHPWRLVPRLSRALIAALGVAAFGLVASDVWRIAASIGPVRLAVLCLLTIAAAVAALIFEHGLWERAADRRGREQAMLFNLVTVITVSFGIVALYAMVFVATLAMAGLMIEPSTMTTQIGHNPDFGNYLRLALLASALATVGGALGGALESDTAVRDAAYVHRPGPS
ncbi:MAG TPA: hypothetical protein VG186_03160 [Solirubrobacteraceae bacterium]|jgi:uncharacterized membrane protein|nr:hypothetical protein [Solirubrobacteraceae bacterium]